MELYEERGFEQTTVAEIAGRAGLTERTFFRHFADKRDVLFGGVEPLRERMVTALQGAPESLSPFEAAAAGILAGAEMIDEGGLDFARRRNAVIAASPELRERELIKLALLTESLARALRDRGVDDQTAGLSVEMAVAAFRVAFDRWVRSDREASLSALVRDSVRQIGLIASGAADTFPDMSTGITP